MQELRFVAVSEDGSYAVLAVPGRSGRYILPIDERLRAVAQGQASRLAQYEIEVESPLRPKEIQARIRAGETAEEIADAAGIPVERVRWFEGPVLAERGYIADQAQAASVRRAGESSGPGPRLGDIVTERLSATGSDPADGQWDSRKRGDGSWQVSLTFPSGGRLHVAEWVFDPRRRHVMPDDDNAARLSLPESELPAEAVPMPGEATVTPIASRLSAAAGMGGGGMAGGGIGGGGAGAFGGSGVGVRAFRPERSVIPDRSLGGDRSLVERPHPPVAPAPAPAPAPERSVATERPVSAERPVSVERPMSAERPVAPERPAMTHAPAAPSALPRPGQRPEYDDAPGYDDTSGYDRGAARSGSYGTGYRDESPEPTGYRDLTLDRLVYRDPSPDRAPAAEASTAPPVPAAPVAPAPVVFEEIPAAARVRVSPPRPVVFEEPEPAFPDDGQLELSSPDTAAQPAPNAPESVSSPFADRFADWTQSATGRHSAPATSAATTEPAAKPTAPSPPSPSSAPPPSVTPLSEKPVSAADQPTPTSVAVQPTNVQPTAVQPTPGRPTPAQPTTRQPTTGQPTTRQATTGQATAVQPQETAPAVPAPSPVAEAHAGAGAANRPGSLDATAPAAASTESIASAAAAKADEPAPESVTTADATAESTDTAQSEAVEAEVQAEAPAPAGEQPARPRQPGKKNAKARRSSVPSWDEIMLGSSRQRELSHSPSHCGANSRRHALPLTAGDWHAAKEA